MARKSKINRIRWRNGRVRGQRAGSWLHRSSSARAGADEQSSTQQTLQQVSIRLVGPALAAAVSGSFALTKHPADPSQRIVPQTDRRNNTHSHYHNLTVLCSILVWPVPTHPLDSGIPKSAVSRCCCCCLRRKMPWNDLWTQRKWKGLLFFLRTRRNRTRAITTIDNRTNPATYGYDDPDYRCYCCRCRCVSYYKHCYCLLYHRQNKFRFDDGQGQRVTGQTKMHRLIVNRFIRGGDGGTSSSEMNLSLTAIGTSRRYTAFEGYCSVNKAWNRRCRWTTMAVFGGSMSFLGGKMLCCKMENIIQGIELCSIASR